MDNIYIRALEIGIKNLDTGIPFDQMAQELEIKKKSMMFKEGFRNWFYDNFFHPGLKEVERSKFQGNNPNIPEHLDKQCSVLTGKAYIDYLDYIELKEARQSSKTAKTIAITSIIITGLIAIAQIIISLCN